MSEFKGDGWTYLAFGGETSLATSETECAKNKAPLSHFQHRENRVRHLRARQTCCLQGDILARSSAVGWQSGRIQTQPQNRALNKVPCFSLQGSNGAFLKKKSLLNSLSDLQYICSCCLMAQLHSNCKNSLTPLCCHVRCLGGEMINTGLLLMRLEGSLAGERWAEVCAPESTHLLQRKHWAEF